MWVEISKYGDGSNEKTNISALSEFRTPKFHTDPPLLLLMHKEHIKHLEVRSLGLFTLTGGFPALSLATGEPVALPGLQQLC